MSAGLPYLRALRKSDLVVLAEVADLKDYGDYKKTELEHVLDDHLRTNQSTLSKESKLSGYYKRLSQPPRASPVKREPKADSSSLLGDDAKRASRPRRAARAKEEVEATDESDASSQRSKSPPATQTPSRPGLSFPSLPPSPAVVTEAIDRQTTRVRKSVSEAWDASGATERTDALRSYLSSVSTIEILITVFELYCLANEIVPFQYLTTVPAVPSVNTRSFAIKIPDVFVLLNASFWAPFSLWLLTSLVVPYGLGYFFNLSLKMSQQPAGLSHNYGTRRAATTAAAQSRRANFDPLVFNVSKALVSYLVYGTHFNFWNVYSTPAIRRVAGAVPGGLRGLLTGSAVCTLGSVYEAILRK